MRPQLSVFLAIVEMDVVLLAVGVIVVHPVVALVSLVMGKLLKKACTLLSPGETFVLLKSLIFHLYKKTLFTKKARLQ
jgi:hypothetical protein